MFLRARRYNSHSCPTDNGLTTCKIDRSISSNKESITSSSYNLTNVWELYACWFLKVLILISKIFVDVSIISCFPLKVFFQYPGLNIKMSLVGHMWHVIFIMYLSLFSFECFKTKTLETRSSLPIRLLSQSQTIVKVNPEPKSLPENTLNTQLKTALKIFIWF